MNSMPNPDIKPANSSDSSVWQKLSQPSRDLILFTVIAVSGIFGLFLLLDGYEKSLVRTDTLTGYILFSLFIFCLLYTSDAADE